MIDFQTGNQPAYANTVGGMAVSDDYDLKDNYLNGETG